MTDKLKPKEAKNKLFKWIAVLLPFVLLLLLECFLRVLNFGYDTHVFIEEKNSAGKPYMYLNPSVTKKYFTYSANKTEGNKEYFSKIKSPNTFRIFVLGESTTVGYPYAHNGSFSRMLKYRLQFTYPDKNFEIINLGITAVSSYTILDFSREIINYQPDAVLIYMGHNEYYGALGVGSTNKLGQNNTLVNSLICMKKLKIVQGTFKLFEIIMTSLHKGITDQTENLMKRMANQKVPYKSQLYEAGISQFSNNLEDILKIYQKKHIPVFISNLVSNEKDQMPFISETIRKHTNDDWNKWYLESISYLKQKNDIKALESLKMACTIDSTYAINQFFIGKLSYLKGDFLKAHRSFVNAKELDLLRFRAPEEINEVIKSMSRKYKANYIDTKSNFEQHSPNGIIGYELILEHLHPNIAGIFLISNSFYNALLSSGLIDATPVDISENKMRREYPITAVDTMKGAFQIYMLKEGWPFNEKTPDSISSKGSYLSKIAGAYAVKQLNWHQAMVLSSEYFEKNNDKKELLKITEGFLLEFPYEREYYSRAVSLSMDLKDSIKAAFYRKKLLSLE